MNPLTINDTRIPITIRDIRELREQYYNERDKGVTLIPQLDVDTTALEKYEPIRLEFAGSGGWQNFCAYRIVGGPDDGKRVDTYPWMPASYLEYGATVFNGSREEYNSYLGYPARPSIACVGSLHAVTVAFLSATLISNRSERMSEHVNSLYERLTPME